MKKTHIVIAIVMAPILAALSYILTDKLVEEPALVAQQGQSYPLGINSNCLYTSDLCILENEDVKIILKPASSHALNFESNIDIQTLKVAISKEASEDGEFALIQNTSGKEWTATFKESLNDLRSQNMKVAFNINGALFFAELKLEFINEIL